MSVPSLAAPAVQLAPPARRRQGLAGATRAFWLFVGPFLVGLIIFVYVPIVWSIVLSFSRAQNTVTPGDWVGLQNYIDLLQPGPFLDSLITFTIFAAFIVPLTFAVSLGLALLLNQVTFMRAFFRSVFSCPPLLVRRGLAGLEAVDLQRRTVRAGQHRAQLVRHRQHRLAGYHRPPGIGWSSSPCGSGSRSGST